MLAVTRGSIANFVAIARVVVGAGNVALATDTGLARGVAVSIDRASRGRCLELVQGATVGGRGVCQGSDEGGVAVAGARSRSISLGLGIVPVIIIIITAHPACMGARDLAAEHGGAAGSIGDQGGVCPLGNLLAFRAEGKGASMVGVGGVSNGKEVITSLAKNLVVVGRLVGEGANGGGRHIFVER